MIEAAIPGMTFRYPFAGTIMVVELIRSEVDANPVKLKPSVGVLSRVAGYVLKACVPVLVKMMCDEVSSVATGSQGKGFHPLGQSHRIALLKQSSEIGDESVKFMGVTLGADGSLFITNGHSEALSSVNEYLHFDGESVRSRVTEVPYPGKETVQ